METNPSSDSKHKGRSAFVENGVTKDSKSYPSTSGSGSSTWSDACRDPPKKREHNSQDREHWSRWEKNSTPIVQETQSKQETREIQEDQQQLQAYQNFTYGATTDATYMNSNHMMSLYSTYGPMPSLNSQWAMGPVDSMGMTFGINANTSAALTMSPGVDMSTNSAAAMNPFAFMGMTGDPNLYGMMGMASYGQYPMIGNEGSMMMAPVKEIVHLTLSSLYPPNPNAPPPSTRPKPLGCKTIFVGGLPENATEEIMREVFQSSGDISVIRMSKKNFCHIRFTEEVHVDNAIFYSGYRIKVGNKDDSPNTGRLHVDYAQARDDQYEYECRQRSLQREARHRERFEQEFYHPPTPPPVVHYSDHEASVLGDKLRNEDTFQEAVLVLITWLDRGECSKKNGGFFYSMIQSTNSHVRRLMHERQKYEDELNEAKMMLKQQMRGILLQFNDIDKVFSAASLQKVWDHFTKAQRRNIEIWKRQTAEIKEAHVEEVLKDRVEDEMDMSDDDADTDNVSKKEEKDVGSVKKHDSKSRPSTNELEKLKEDNDSLRCQLLASQNEMAVVSSEMEEIKDSCEFELQQLRATFDNCYKDLRKRMSDGTEVEDIRPPKLKRSESNSKDNVELCLEKEDVKKDKTDADIQVKCIPPVNTGSLITISGRQARLIGLISTFLAVHPFGASIDYICSYLYQIDGTIHARDVEMLMKKFPVVFKEESTGIGASLEKKWTFCGFKKI